MLEELWASGAAPWKDGHDRPRLLAGRRVLLTGHTGFKGAGWRCGSSGWAPRYRPRAAAGTEPALFALLAAADGLVARASATSATGRGRGSVAQARPEIVIHMAAQALVRRSYRDPVETFCTNVMGTAHLLEALRGAPRARRPCWSITTDKVYRNNGQRPCLHRGRSARRRTIPIRRRRPRPRSSSRAMARELLCAKGVAVATARAGNVIGGGDWSEDRLIPDVWRAVQGRRRRCACAIPQATRPWQHVLEPLAGYLALCRALAAGADVPQRAQLRPAAGRRLTVAEVADAMLAAMGCQRALGHGRGAAAAGGASPGARPALAHGRARLAAAAQRLSRRCNGPPTGTAPSRAGADARAMTARADRALRGAAMTARARLRLRRAADPRPSSISG